MTPPTALRPPLAALRAFAEFARHASMTRAADALGVTVSAVSHQLVALESALGAQLIDRRPRPAVLTALGQQYAARLGPAFESIQAATADLFEKARPSRLTLTTYPLFAVKWLLPRLSSFHLAYPDIDLTLQSTNRMLDLRAGEADVALRFGNGRWPHCLALPLMPDRTVVVCAPALLRGRRGRQALLTSLPLIVSERSGQHWRRWLKAHGIGGVTVRADRLFDEPLAAVEAALAGAGLALTLHSLVERELQAGRLVEALPSTHRSSLQHYIVMQPEARQRPAVRCLVEWLATQVSAAPTPARPRRGVSPAPPPGPRAAGAG